MLLNVQKLFWGDLSLSSSLCTSRQTRSKDLILCVGMVERMLDRSLSEDHIEHKLAVGNVLGTHTLLQLVLEPSQSRKGSWVSQRDHGSQVLNPWWPCPCPSLNTS
jgi:hypothetical protein